MSQFRQPPGNFKVVLGIMLSIQKNNGKLDSDMDNDVLRLWVYALMGGLHQQGSAGLRHYAKRQRRASQAQRA
jgi:hypothetical protein